MASQELIGFLRSVDEKCAQYAQLLQAGTFTDRLELSAADKFDLEALGVPKGAAGLIMEAAQGTGDKTFDEAGLAELLSGLDHVPSPEEAKDMLLSYEPQRKIPVVRLADQYLPGLGSLDWDWCGHQTVNQASSAPDWDLFGYQAVNKTPGTPTVVEELDFPDMLIWAEGATFYIGEDKGKGDIAEAREDVRRYMRGGLPKMAYGEVPYIFAHAAAGSKVQLGLIMADGQVDWMGVLDLVEHCNRAMFVSALVAMVGIIRRLVGKLPPDEFRRKLLYIEDRGHGVAIQFLGDRVKKTILNFPKWSAKHAPHSSKKPAFNVLTSVYDVCNNTSGALVRTVHSMPPTLNTRTDTYTVDLQLCGPPVRPRTAEHVISLAKSCCTATAGLHRAKLVHRDFRLGNVVRTSNVEGLYTVIDMEHAGMAGQKWTLEKLRDWDEGTLDKDGRYVPSSDVYQIGIMLHDISGGINMPSQFDDMVKQMLQKSISAEKACQMLP
ncbi:g5982 [Coccomyxa elongata]